MKYFEMRHKGADEVNTYADLIRKSKKELIAGAVAWHVHVNPQWRKAQIADALSKGISDKINWKKFREGEGE